MKIADDVYAYYWQNPSVNNCNTYLIQGKVTVLIDPGHAAHVSGLKDLLRKDGIKLEQIGLIINTHAHPDHMEANAEFDQPGMLYAMHADEERFIEDVGRSMYMQMGIPFPKYRIDFYLQDGDLKLGGIKLEVIHTPGHSPGSICLLFPEYGILYSGDLIFANGVGRVDLPGGDPEKLKTSIEKVARLKAAAIFPGHGPPVIGPEKVENLMTQLKRYMTQYV